MDTDLKALAGEARAIARRARALLWRAVGLMSGPIFFARGAEGLRAARGMSAAPGRKDVHDQG